MPKKKNEDDLIVTKLSADEIFDALRNPDVKNVFLLDGNLAGKKVKFVGSERRSDGEVVPIALLLDKKAMVALDDILMQLDEREEDDENSDEDEDEDEDDLEDEDEDDLEP